ncbi:MAG TPA: MBL fold metallo-hydrolase, partial [Rhodocyclaceae bacterium]|nr:MBL fold metallo-hydrolase [Rhodocyclaceae bacterium]
MKQVKFWGTRGSLPVALTAEDVQQKIVAALKAARGQRLEDDAALEAFVAALPFATRGTFGGNSSCVEIVTGGDSHVICDMGSGLRPLGQAKLAAHGPAKPQTYHVFVSHLHWDHLMGFPFFTPIYIPGNRIVIHGCHAGLEQAVRQQLSAPGFPVDYSQLAATIEFDLLAPGQTHAIAGMEVTPMLQVHGGDSYGYRFEAGGKAVVYSTDSEHKLESAAEMDVVARFFQDADLVIFDAMYSLADAVSIKADWGHSSNLVGVELCQQAGAKRLALFHHEPVFSDAKLADLLQETR